jgi:hypothetical protein
VARHRKLRGALLSAAACIGVLLAGTGATYALIGQLHSPMAGARHPDGRSAASRPGPAVPEHRATPAASPARNSPPASGQGPLPSVSSPDDDELAQLGQIAVLLQRSVKARSLVTSATRGVASCVLSTGAGLRRMDGAIRSRQQLISTASTAAVSAIPGGIELRTELEMALRFSAVADVEFAAWMRDVGHSVICPVPMASDSAYQIAMADSALAGRAKSQFLRQWNRVAASSGQPAFGSGQI